MLIDLLDRKYEHAENLNCAQKILHASNEAYNMELDCEALKLASGFGGGMGIESTCGVLTAGVMVLGKLFPSKDAESKCRLKKLTKEYISSYKEKMGHIDCAPLKEMHRIDGIGCKNVIREAAIILDRVVKRELK